MQHDFETPQRPISPFTIDHVFDCIGFEKESGIYKTLYQMVENWNRQGLSNGLTDEEAAKFALDQLSAQMLKMARAI